MPDPSDFAEFQRRLAADAAATEAMLAHLLEDASTPGEICRPSRLLAAMRHAVLGGGKRLRPFLVIETARLFGAASEGVARAGAALELLHCYSLVHDDLPAMDDDDLRRGRPTVHKAFDEATAVLAGDALLTLAFDVVAAPETHADPAVRAELTLKLARAAGCGGMCGGQMLDLAAEAAQTPLSLAEIARLQAMKTGALILFAVEAGAILGGAAAPARAALAGYGRALGEAFQIADDLLDAEGDEAALGKRAGKDADRNKATFVSVLGLDGARARLADLVRQAQAALDGAAPRANTGVLRATARFIAERRH
jgi:farnesyl diphosphate synthase